VSAALTIAGRRVGLGEPPFIIAELSANHGGDRERALRLLEAAAAAGADAVKLQTYRADTITLDSRAPEFMIEGGLWAGRSLYELYEAAHTPWEWHEALFARGRELGVTVFSAPFDLTAVDFLEGLGCPAYKVASFELVDHPLVAAMARTGKPLIMSTGMASCAEIEEAVRVARDAGAAELALLHCVSGYPSSPADYHLATLQDMQRRFHVPVGLSDHTLGSVTAIAAVALGACIVEKHFTLSRAEATEDAAFSLEPGEFRSMADAARSAAEAIGGVNYSLKGGEADMVRYRRSLYVVKPLRAGATLDADSVRSVRPGYGLPPSRLPEVLGMRVCRDIPANTALREDMLEPPRE
jgi:pseudaminic acid synthase